MSTSRHIFVASSLAASLFLIGAGCGTSTSPDNASPSPMPPENIPAASATPTQNMGSGMGMMQPQTPPELTEVQKAELQAGETAHEPKELTFHVVGGSFYYVPNVIKVKKGDKVKIVFDNAGGMHNFVLDEFNVKLDPIKGGESSTVEFTADKAGTFEYYCSVGKHREMGQKGQLIVVE